MTTRNDVEVVVNSKALKYMDLPSVLSESEALEKILLDPDVIKAMKGGWEVAMFTWIVGKYASLVISKPRKA